MFCKLFLPALWHVHAKEVLTKCLPWHVSLFGLEDPHPHQSSLHSKKTDWVLAAEQEWLALQAQNGHHIPKMKLMTPSEKRMKYI